MAVKIEDVARYAGVSTATVSRVLSGKQHVSQELRERVLAAIQDLNYRPSRVARSLRIQRSSIIGLIISDIQNPFFTSIVRAVEDVAQRSGYSVLLCNSDEDTAKEMMYIELMLAEHVAGIIVSPTDSESDMYLRLLEAGVPVVAIDRRVESVEIDTVINDNVAAARRIVEHLIDNGHRRIGAVIGVMQASTGYERYRGYRAALEAHGLPVDENLVRVGMPRSHIGYTLTKELLALENPPTAIFTGNNLLTVGALRAIDELGLCIPDNVALAAFDEMEWMFLIKPAITVVAQPTYEMGRSAAELLMRRIAEPDRSPQQIVLSAEIKFHESSMGPNSAYRKG
ncbi:MAG: LacI family DNA-binding transcriptional regulator [Caldilineaceae bacterium]|nr:LacI family DNA-binding transcriptional regulator [Caldilineaceae bacterium]